MRTISYRAEDLRTAVIGIGYVGENEHTQVRIDCGTIFAEYPAASAGMTIVPPAGAAYPKVVTRDGDVVVWDVTDSDLASEGSGEIQLSFVVSNVVVKSCIAQICVQRSITGNGPAPDPMDDWLTEASETLAEVDEALAAIPETIDTALEQAKASGEFDGPQGEPGQDGQDGAPGADGFSPTATVTKSGKVATITITDKNGTTTATVSDGEGGGAEIDDTAGEGDTDKAWSADKLTDEFGSVLNEIGELSDKKLTAPTTVGTANQVLTSDGNGGQVWAAIGQGEITVDSTLSVEGSAADAKATGAVKATATMNDLYINGYDFDLTASADTSFSLVTGQKVVLQVTGIKDGGAVYTKNFSSDVYYTISAKGTYEITARHDGPLRFYIGSGNRIRGKFLAHSRFDDVKVPVPAFDSVAIKTIKVFDSFPVNTGSFSFNNDATIATYASYASSSSVAQNVPPIKVRNDDGSLIYKNLHLTATSNADVTALWSFDKYGYYLRTVNITQYRARQKPILDDEYYIIPNQYTTIPSNEWKVENVDIEWLNNVNKHEYFVGTGGDFATLTAALTALADDDSEKTIYIKPGEYNIFTEMGGADYMAEISESASELNWRDVCPVVPPNTKIIGLGDVVLKWDATAAQMVNSATAFLFSPLNVSGSCHIENIKIVAQNCRYAIHDETSGKEEYNGAKHYYKNCSFTMLSGTYGGTPFGSGHNRLMEFDFDNCVFNSQNDKCEWSTHDWTTPQNESSTFTFNNCVFISTKTDPFVNFSSDDPYGRKDKVLFNNCYLNKIKFVNGSGSAKQGYEVTLIGCTPVEVETASSVTDRYDTMQYNSIPQSE